MSAKPFSIKPSLTGRNRHTNGDLKPNACLRWALDAKSGGRGGVKVTQGLTHRSNRHIMAID